jgi:hypothetical protein
VKQDEVSPNNDRREASYRTTLRSCRQVCEVFGFSGPSLNQDPVSLVTDKNLRSCGREQVLLGVKLHGKLSYLCPKSGCCVSENSVDRLQYWHFGRGRQSLDMSTRCQNICALVRPFHYCGGMNYQVFQYEVLTGFCRTPHLWQHMQGCRLQTEDSFSRFMTNLTTNLGNVRLHLAWSKTIRFLCVCVCVCACVCVRACVRVPIEQEAQLINDISSTHDGEY